MADAAEAPAAEAPAQSEKPAPAEVGESPSSSPEGSPKRKGGKKGGKNQVGGFPGTPPSQSSPSSSRKSNGDSGPRNAKGRGKKKGEQGMNGGTEGRGRGKGKGPTPSAPLVPAMPGMMGGAPGMDIQALQRQMQSQGVALPMMMPGMMPMMPYGYPFPGMPGMPPMAGGYGMPGLMQPPGHFGVPGLGMDRAELEGRILTQLEYYFSEENLRKDTYLRDQLDAGGWAQLELVCGFKRLASLLLCTNDQAILFHSLDKSTLLELDPGRTRIRRRDGFRGVGTLPASSSSN